MVRLCVLPTAPLATARFDMMELCNQSSAFIRKFLRSESGMTLVPIGDALERVPGADETCFLEVAADKLESDGAAVRGKAAGKRNRRASGHVEGTGKAKQPGDQRRVFATRAHLGERGRGKSLRRNRDEIDRFEHRSHRPTKRFTPQHDLLIVLAGL